MDLLIMKLSSCSENTESLFQVSEIDLITGHLLGPSTSESWKLVTTTKKKISTKMFFLLFFNSIKLDLIH